MRLHPWQRERVLEGLAMTSLSCAWLRGALILCAVLGVLRPGVAVAAASLRVAIVPGGAVSAPVAEALGARLPGPWSPAPPEKIVDALRDEGQVGVIGAALKTREARAELVERARRAARRGGVDAILFLRTSRVDDGRRVDLLLVAPDREQPVLDTSVDIVSTAAAGQELVRATVSRSLGSLEAAAPEPLAPAATRAAGVDPAGALDTAPSPPVPMRGAGAAPDHAAREASDGAVSVFALSAGAGTSSRFLRILDRKYEKDRAYRVPAVLSGILEAELYPFARGGSWLLRGLGVAAGVQSAVGLRSDLPDGASAPATWIRGEATLHERLLFGARGWLSIGLFAGVVGERFAVDEVAPEEAKLPNTKHLEALLGGEARLSLRPLALLAGAAFAPQITAGAPPDPYNRASSHAVEGRLGVAVPVNRHFEVRAMASYRRVLYTFHEGSRTIGGLDELVRGQLLGALLL
jgi:hypothetical protein